MLFSMVIRLEGLYVTLGQNEILQVNVLLIGSQINRNNETIMMIMMMMKIRSKLFNIGRIFLLL